MMGAFGGCATVLEQGSRVTEASSGYVPLVIADGMRLGKAEWGAGHCGARRGILTSALAHAN